MKRPKELSCREVVELITAYLEGALTWRERRRFESHIAGCEGCTRYLAQMRAIEHDKTDAHFASEARFESFGDALGDEVGETLRADVPPAAADHQKEEEKAAGADESNRLEAAPHRPLALAFARRAVMAVPRLMREERLAARFVLVHHWPCDCSAC